MAKKNSRSSSGNSFLERVVGFLFAIVVLIASAIAFDYVLFAFQRTPLFAVKAVEENKTEHIGLVYVVTEEADNLRWDWIWEKL